MFKIRQVHGAVSAENQTALSAVLHIYQEAFAYYPQYAVKIAELLKFTNEQEFDVILLVAEGWKKRIAGFILSFFFYTPALCVAGLHTCQPETKYATRRARVKGWALIGILPGC